MQPRTTHRVCLAGARLAVCKGGGVEATHHAVGQLPHARRVKDILLHACGVGLVASPFTIPVGIYLLECGSDRLLKC